MKAMISKTNTERASKGCFSGTAEAYAKYRPPYPKLIIEDIVNGFVLDGKQTVLDVGCGTGHFSIPLSPYVLSILAIDKDPDMIRTAELVSSQQGINNITYKNLSGEEIGPNLGKFDLAVFGTSFHWMDKQKLTGTLQQALSNKGGVAILTAFYIWHGNEPWKEIVRQTIKSFTGEDRSKGLRELAEEKDDRTILLRAGFNKLKYHKYSIKTQYTLDNLLGFLETTSYASRRRLGNKAEEFYRGLRTKLMREFGKEPFIENVEYTLLTATKG